ncbi:prepilin-type N-terminal cleavage/methylation domain-containing protein [Eubacterium multiforme]|uniref:Type IV pilus assembly protein PilA n=1 Tax=Eubacterium multiforme TaxID=83339 RepID=A0ABT9UNR9_9FIRM|nr:prepilin-type N-terminal cleavage/methylation domain-containing protein [Eubacterium multiforme]MDQ0148286.1 type IV pilus assembly protein PilA [Eubacterium multiforme]
MKKKGFTLIELIAVIAILAILAAIAVPRVIQYVDKSKKVAIQSEAKVIYNAAEAAYNDGLLVPNSNNVYVKRNEDGKPVSNETVKFDNMVLFSSLCQDGKGGVVEILIKNNRLNANEVKDDKMFGPAYTLGMLKNIINTDPSKLVLDSDGSLKNW